MLTPLSQISDFEIYALSFLAYLVLYRIIFCIFVPGTPLDIKHFIVLLHTLSAYNSLLVRYKVYSSNRKECLCTSWRYAETYENFSIDPAPCRKNPRRKNKTVIPNCQPLLLGENYVEIKAWQLKFA